MATHHYIVVKSDLQAARESETETSLNTRIAAGYELVQIVPTGNVATFIFLGDEAARQKLTAMINGSSLPTSVMIGSAQPQSSYAPGAGPVHNAPQTPEEANRMLARGEAYVNEAGQFTLGRPQVPFL